MSRVCHRTHVACQSNPQPKETHESCILLHGWLGVAHQGKLLQDKICVNFPNLLPPLLGMALSQFVLPWAVVQPRRARTMQPMSPCEAPSTIADLYQPNCLQTQPLRHKATNHRGLGEDTRLQALILLT